MTDTKTKNTENKTDNKPETKNEEDKNENSTPSNLITIDDRKRLNTILMLDLENNSNYTNDSNAGLKAFTVMMNSIEIIANEEKIEKDKEKNDFSVGKQIAEVFRSCVVDGVKAIKHKNDDNFEKAKNKLIETLGDYADEKIDLGRGEITLGDFIENNFQNICSFSKDVFFDKKFTIKEKDMPDVQTLKSFNDANNFIMLLQSKNQDELNQNYVELLEYIGNLCKERGEFKDKYNRIKSNLENNRKITENNTKTIALSGAALVGAGIIAVCPILFPIAAILFMFQANKNPIGTVPAKIVEGTTNLLDQAFKAANKQIFLNPTDKANETSKIEYINASKQQEENLKEKLPIGSEFTGDLDSVKNIKHYINNMYEQGIFVEISKLIWQQLNLNRGNTMAY